MFRDYFPSVSQRSTAMMSGLLLAGSLLAGDSFEAAAAPPPASSDIGLQRCYEQPQPSPDTDLQASTGPIAFRAVDESGRVEGADLRLSSEVLTHVVQATVEIDLHGGAKGSGYVAEDRWGRQVIVTAAHVAKYLPMDTISITNYLRETTGVSGGCYMYEAGGHFTPFNPNDRNPQDIDIAVLLPTQPFAIQALEQASYAARPGDNLYTVTYQKNHKPGNPVTYPLVVTGILPNMQLLAVSALRIAANYPAGESVDDIHLSQGASGGVDTNAMGEVEAINISSTRPIATTSLTVPDLLDKAALVLAGPGTGLLTQRNGFDPDIGHLMSLPVINAALMSPRA